MGVLLLALALAQSPAPPRDRAAAPAPTTGTSVMRGRVLAADGMPLRRAQITAIAVAETPGLSQRHGTTTDVDGKWEITDLPAGRYSLSASKAGYVTMQYGQRRPFEQGTPVVVAAAATVDRLDVTLQRGAVISGRLVDEFGEPVAGIGVQAMRYTYSNDGQRRLNAISGSPTDDLGQFRVFGLMPGDYVLQATPGVVMLGVGGSGPAPDTFATTFYPGTVNADEAQTVTLTLGQETSLPFQLVSAKTTRVTGVVVNADGAPVPGMQLSLVTPIGSSGWSSGPAGSTAADGTFTINSVAPGDHSITTRVSRAGDDSEFANYAFTAAGEPLNNVRIVTSKGATLTGRVVWEGNTPRGTTPVRVNVQQDATGPTPFIGGSVQSADGTLNDDNTFKLAGAYGKGFIRAFPIPAGWGIKSVTVDGDDVTDLPIDLTSRLKIDDIRLVLTDKLTDLTGTVTDARGTLLKDYVVIVLPSGLKEGLSPRRYVSMLRPDQNGSFRTKGLPPGSYTATALEWVEQGRQFVPTFQEQLRKAGKTFTLREGEPATIDLKLTGGL